MTSRKWPCPYPQCVASWVVDPHGLDNAVEHILTPHFHCSCGKYTGTAPSKHQAHTRNRNEEHLPARVIRPAQVDHWLAAEFTNDEPPEPAARVARATWLGRLRRMVNA